MDRSQYHPTSSSSWEKRLTPVGDLGPGLSSSEVPPGEVGTFGADNTYPKYVRLGFANDPFDLADDSKAYSPSKPETAENCRNEQADEFFHKAKAAYDNGVWQTDASTHARKMDVDKSEVEDGTTLLEPKPGMRTLKLAYFFSGVKRKASIAEELKALCRKDGFGLIVYEVDVLVGGRQHDLLDQEAQEDWLLRLEDGEFDCIILSPPCGSWSRFNWANDDGPQPCR